MGFSKCHCRKVLLQPNCRKRLVGALRIAHPPPYSTSQQLFHGLARKTALLPVARDLVVPPTRTAVLSVLLNILRPLLDGNCGLWPGVDVDSVVFFYRHAFNSQLIPAVELSINRVYVLHEKGMLCKEITNMELTPGSSIVLCMPPMRVDTPSTVGPSHYSNSSRRESDCKFASTIWPKSLLLVFENRLYGVIISALGQWGAQRPSRDELRVPLRYYVCTS
jgi:hypothetical protein